MPTKKKATAKKKTARRGGVKTNSGPPARREQSAEVVPYDPGEKQELARPSKLGQVSGETTSADVVYPRLALMHKTSKAVDEGRFNILDVVVNGEVYVGDSEYPADLAVLSARKRYEEDLDFDDPATPRVWDTLEEVHAAGLWTEWQNNERPPARPILETVLAVKMPEHAHAGEVDGDPDVSLEFPYEDDNGDRWALCIWDMKGSAYTQAGKAVITAGQTTPVHLIAWSLTTDKKVYGKNTVTIPKMRKAGTNDEATVAFFESLLG